LRPKCELSVLCLTDEESARTARIARIAELQHGQESGAAVIRQDGSLAAVSGLAWIVPLDARNRTQILVDRTNVVVCQALIIGPRHDLEKITVERRRYAAWVYKLRDMM
jgi:hypothetical protein